MVNSLDVRNDTLYTLNTVRNYAPINTHSVLHDNLHVQLALSS